MPKVVVLGSCRFQPYEFLAVPQKNEKWNTEEGYKLATKKFYPAIRKADEVWVYAPEGWDKLGEHTKRDLAFTADRGKPIFIILKVHPCSPMAIALNIKREAGEKKKC
jgi:hypothetical protein